MGTTRPTPRARGRITAHPTKKVPGAFAAPQSARHCFNLLGLVLWLVTTLAPLGCSPPTVIEAHFQSPQSAQGWAGVGARQQTWHLTWMPATDDQRGYVRVESGALRGPAFPVQADRYYRIQTTSRSAGPGFVATLYYGPTGLALAADDHTGLPASDGWAEQVVYSRARQGAATARLQLTARGAPLSIASAAVHGARAREVLRWADRLRAQAPPVAPGRVPQAPPLIARSAARVGPGEPIRIVLLGDSIMNDLGNGPLDLLLERAKPGLDVKLINSVRSGSGCTYYREHNRVQPYVLDHQPHLVIIGGISHRRDVAAIRDVVRQIQAGCDAQVLVLSGAVADDGWSPPATNAPPSPRAKASAAWRHALSEACDEMGVAFFDLRESWEMYLAQTGFSRTKLMRDEVHANALGRLVLNDLLIRYLNGDRSPYRSRP